jgi:hypothetical protein
MKKKQEIITILSLVIATGYFFLVLQGNVSAQGHEHHHHAEIMKTPEVIVDLETRPPVLQAGTPASILFSIKDSEGRALRDLTITHDRLLHVIIASKDFSVFAHIHPEDSGPVTDEMKKKAEFTVVYTFPKAGQYLIAVDSAVKDVPFSEHFNLDVTGEPSMGPLKKDLSREKGFGDYRVVLVSTPAVVTAGKETTLIYRIQKNGTAVTDLEPYLSAPMHVAVISADLNTFIHAHGELPGEESAPHHAGGHMHGSVPGKFGPEIRAHIIFPIKGLYQVFSEIKHQGRVIPLSFMVDVE